MTLAISVTKWILRDNGVYIVLMSHLCYSVQFCSVAQSWPTLCDRMDCSMLGLLVHNQLPEFTQTQVHSVSDVIQPSHSLVIPFSSYLLFPSTRAFSSESVLHIRWPKYWSFNFSISPSNEYLELFTISQSHGIEGGIVVTERGLRSSWVKKNNPMLWVMLAHHSITSHRTEFQTQDHYIKAQTSAALLNVFGSVHKH